jgi:protein-S-isoprenylcysteine O-methyltransferase Ste14
MAAKQLSPRLQAMTATDFEVRHQTLIHLLIVGVAFLTYLIDRDDIVWALVQGQTHPRLFERLLFALATLLIGVSTALRTWAGAYAERPASGLAATLRCDGPYRYVRYPLELGSLFFSIGLGFLAPMSGFVILVAGETIVAFRLIGREEKLRSTVPSQPASLNECGSRTSHAASVPGAPDWKASLRRESGKWGVFLTMIIFTVLLSDRVAEILAVLSLLIGMVLNWRHAFRPGVRSRFPHP